jgi:tetratricopeptide (TPR) repeat protein
MTSSHVRSRGNFVAAACAIALLILLAYANHFENAFHFDDSHTILENPYIRDLHNIPKFFESGDTFSTLPANRSYRPLVTTSLAIDYQLSKGLHPLWFHITTFVWFLLQILLLFALFQATLDRVEEGPQNRWIALFAAGLYGVHPVIAETVNYIIQRSEIYFTLALVAAFVVYIRAPRLRKYGLYLIPAVMALLSKPTAAVFPVLLFAWIWLFEEENIMKAAARSIPAFVVCGAATAFVAHMTPPTYITGAQSAFDYRITQPYVLLGYFVKFFAPVGLSADSDRTPFTTIGPDAITGFAFVAALIGFAWWCLFGGGKSRRELRPLAFGAIWFLVASIPTSWIPLAEVENDHRMYFPFVGLALAVCQGGALLCARRPRSVRVLVPACAVLLAVFAWGTRERNRVWQTDESLWQDVTEKSPRNGRGLMNYGLTQMAKGNYAAALDLFNRALAFNPAYYILEINLGIAYAATNNAAQAQTHFSRAIALAPAEASPRYYYARWLYGSGRAAEAAAALQDAVRLNPDYVESRYLLMQIDADAGDGTALRQEAQAVLTRFPADPTAAAWLARSANPAGLPRKQPTPESWLAASLAYFQAGRFADCVSAAKEALKLRPDYAEAWNNVGACSNSLSQWDAGIEACNRAIQLKPDFQLARNNLAWAEKEKAKSGR